MLKVLVVGLGNRMYGDDGYGDVFAEALLKCGVKGLNVLQGAHLGLGLLGFLAGYDVLIFIDIVDPQLAKSKPGTVKVFEIDPSKADVEDYIHLFRSTEAHSISPTHIVSLLYSSKQFSGKAYVIGVVPESLEFAKPISNTLRKATMTVLDKLKKLMYSLGIHDVEVNDKCIINYLEHNFTV